MGGARRNGATAFWKLARGLYAVLLGFHLSCLWDSGHASHLLDHSFPRRSAAGTSPFIQYHRAEVRKVVDNDKYDIFSKGKTTPAARKAEHSARPRQLDAPAGADGSPILPLGVPSVGGKFSAVASELSISDTTTAQTFTDESTLLQLAAAWGYRFTGSRTWIRGAPCSGWTGVTCDASGSHVTELDLQSNYLAGSIPSAVGSLTALVTLRLSYNVPGLQGTIPDIFGTLGKLRTLDLSFNNLSGSLPASLRNLTGLTELNLGVNSLEGGIPASVGEMTSLVSLKLSDNSPGFSGPIPAAISGLVFLRNLDLSKNALSGTVPSVLGKLGFLVTLDLSFNTLAGAIPPALGKNLALRELILESNQFSGSIPQALSTLRDLQTLNLAGNLLTGSLPASLQYMTRLRHL